MYQFLIFTTAPDTQYARFTMILNAIVWTKVKAAHVYWFKYRCFCVSSSKADNKTFCSFPYFNQFAIKKAVVLRRIRTRSMTGSSKISRMPTIKLEKDTKLSTSILNQKITTVVKIKGTSRRFKWSQTRDYKEEKVTARWR